MDHSTPRLLYETFHRSPKFKVQDGAGIITACDDGFFPLAQVMLLSITLSHEVPIALFDLGLSELNRDWLLTVPNLRILKCSSHVMPTNINGWQTYNKPFYIQDSPFDKTIWIDCDCVVLDDLNHLVNLLRHNPVMFQCYHVKGGTHNDPQLHALMGTNLTPHQSGPPIINAGILGFDKRREFDSLLLADWCEATKRAVGNRDIQRHAKYWDQGLLQWTLESKCVLPIIHDDKRWNCPATIESSLRRSCYKVFNYSTGSILHFAGHGKGQHEMLFRNWEPVPEHDIVEASKEEEFGRLMIHVLHHGVNKPSIVQPWLKLVNLNELSLPEVLQRNDFSECRFFLSSEAEQFETEYVGVVSGSWDKKYGKLCPLNKLYFAVAAALEPDIVWFPDPALNGWIDQSEKDHPGMSVVLREVMKITGINSITVLPFYANTFICHRKVYEEYLVWFREAFQKVYDRYGLQPPFSVGRFDKNRKFAYLAERMTMLYFANRADLRLVKVGDRPRKLFKGFL